MRVFGSTNLGATALAGLLAGALPAQGPLSPPANLVAWWPLDGSPADLGPLALDGQLGGAGGAWEAAQVGLGFRPADPDGHVAVIDGPALDVRVPFTYELWVRVDGLRPAHSYLVSKGSSDHRATPYALGIVQSSGAFPTTSGASVSGLAAPGRPFVVLSDGSLEQVIIGSQAVPQGAFAHLAFTIARISSTQFQCRIYLNGREVGFAWLGRLPFNGAAPLQIGGIAGGGAHAVDGAIDEVTLYDRALAAPEILALFNAGPDGKLKPNHDTTPPQITIDAPAEGAVLGAPSVALSATVVDESPTSVFSLPSGLLADLPAGGGVASGTVLLSGPDGAQLLTVQAADSAGNTAATSVSVVLDTTPPQVAFLSPAEGAVLVASPASVAFDVGDLTATSIDVNGIAQALPAGGGVLALDLPLAPGANDIRLRVTDEAGHRTEVVRHVVLDLSAPLVSILSPPDGALLGAGQEDAAVLARVDDLTATTVGSSPAGVAAALPPGGGVVGGAVPLAEGLNQITVAATDGSGRTGSASITVNLDTTGPQAAFAAPAAGELVRGTVEVLVDAVDAAPGSGIGRVELWNGGALLAQVAGATLRFDLDTQTLADGDHMLRAVAFDGAGNQGAAVLSISVDNTAPSAQILSPLAGLASGTVPFVALASDGGSGVVAVTQRVGGNAPTLDGSRQLASPQPSVQVEGSEDTTRWPNGPVAFEVEVTDRAGNVATISVDVDVQNEVPVAEAPELRPRDGRRVHGVVRLDLSSGQADRLELELQVDGETVARSPQARLLAKYDTRRRLDGPMEIRGLVRTTGGATGETVHTVQVDNMHVAGILPSSLGLEGRGRGEVQVWLVGPNLRLLRALPHGALELRVPGGAPLHAARVTGVGRCDELLVVRFDRGALVASLRAALATGQLEPRARRVELGVFANGVEIGKARVRLSQGRGCRGR